MRVFKYVSMRRFERIRDIDEIKIRLSMLLFLDNGRLWYTRLWFRRDLTKVEYLLSRMAYVT